MAGQAERSIAAEEAGDVPADDPIDLEGAAASYPQEEGLEEDRPIAVVADVRIRPVVAAGRSYVVDCTTFAGD